MCAAGSVAAYRTGPSEYNTIPRYCHPAVLTPSPSLKTPGVLCKAKGSFPLGWAIGILPEGRGVRVCQAGLGGLPSPFLQGFPDLLSGPKKQNEDYWREGEAETTKPDPSPCSRGRAPQEWMACLCLCCGPRMALSYFPSPLPHPEERSLGQRAEEGNENKPFLHPFGLVWKEPAAEMAIFLRVSGRKPLTTVEIPGGPGWPGGPCGP